MSGIASELANRLEPKKGVANFFTCLDACER